jgi:MFS family permease
VTSAGASARSSLWRYGDFLKLWSAQTISLIGTQLTQLALPLTAVLWLEASPFEVGALAAAQYVPFIIIGLVAGAWVDRIRRRPVLLVSDMIRAVLLAVIPIAYLLDGLHLWMLYPIAFAVGVFNVFFDVAHQSYLPSLVRREQLLDGNTKLQFSYAGAQLIGPGLGGVLVQVLTAPVTLLVDAASFVGSALLLVRIRGREQVSLGGQESSRPRLLSQVRDGVRFVAQHPYLRPIALSTAVDNIFGLGGMLAPVLVIYAVRDLHMSPATLGFVMAASNAGALLGALLNKRLSNLIGVGPAIVASACVPGVMTLLLPFATPSSAWVVFVISLGISWFAIAVFNVNQVSLRQAVTPDRLLGRMNATIRFVIWGTIPIGALLGGLLAELIGVWPTLWVSAAGSILAAAPLLLSNLRSLAAVPALSDDNADADSLAPITQQTP